jgi:hypothetical protein
MQISERGAPGGQDSRHEVHHARSATPFRIDPAPAAGRRARVPGLRACPGDWPPSKGTSRRKEEAAAEGDVRIGLAILRRALENAVSVASVLLLTEATMTEMPEKKERLPEPEAV